MERRRNRVHGDGGLIDDPVDLFRAHSGMDLLRHCVQAGHVDLGALPDTLDLFRSLDNTSVRRYMSLELEGPDLIVKTHVAVLIFLSAAAPARIISFNLSCKMNHKLLTSFCIMVSLQTILMQRNYESFFCNCQARSACTHKAVYAVQRKTPGRHFRQCLSGITQCTICSSQKALKRYYYLMNSIVSAKMPSASR